MMQIAFLGKGERAAACLEAMAAAGYAPRWALAEGGDEAFTAAARRLGAAAFTSVEDLRKVKPDLAILCGYTKILKEPFISLPRLGTINLHGGKLPEYRGASVLNWQIINGEKEGGIAILCVDEGIDTGGILAEARFPIARTDTINDVVEKTNKLFPAMLVETLRQLEAGAARPKPQPNAGAYWHKRNPEDGRIFWARQSAENIYNLVRALTKPYPGAFTFLEGKKVFVWQTRVPDVVFRGVPGRIVRRLGNGFVAVAADAGLVFTDYEVEGLDREASEHFIKARIGANFDS